MVLKESKNNFGNSVHTAHPINRSGSDAALHWILFTQLANWVDRNLDRAIALWHHAKLGELKCVVRYALLCLFVPVVAQPIELSTNYILRLYPLYRAIY